MRNGQPKRMLQMTRLTSNVCKVQGEWWIKAKAEWVECKRIVTMIKAIEVNLYSSWEIKILEDKICGYRGENGYILSGKIWCKTYPQIEPDFL